MLDRSEAANLLTQLLRPENRFRLQVTPTGVTLAVGNYFQTYDIKEFDFSKVPIVGQDSGPAVVLSRKGLF
jgi:hypothetical protein